MTPLERADKVRDGLKRESPRLLADVLVHIPPGSLILTPDEAEKVREAFELWATAHHLSGYEIDVRGEVLALLAGEGQT